MGTICSAGSEEPAEYFDQRFGHNSYKHSHLALNCIRRRRQPGSFGWPAAVERDLVPSPSFVDLGLSFLPPSPVDSGTVMEENPTAKYYQFAERTGKIKENADIVRKLENVERGEVEVDRPFKAQRVG